MPIDPDPSFDESPMRALEHLFLSMDPVPGFRFELLDGRIQVSPAAGHRHARIVRRLERALAEVEEQNGWWLFQNHLVGLAGWERAIPDLVVAADDACSRDDLELSARGVFLVAEVVSASSGDNDRVYKVREYARANVPLYLLIDPIDDPATVELFSDPGSGGYRISQRTDPGDKLHLPKPFDLDLDVAALLG